MNITHLIQNIKTYAQSPQKAFLAMICLLEYRIAKHSELVDLTWIEKEYRNNDPAADPLLQYLVCSHTGKCAHASETLTDDEYREINELSHWILPAVHYALIGKRKKCAWSYLEKEINDGQVAGVKSHIKYSLEEHQSQLKETARKIGEKSKSGLCVNVAFLVFKTSMFGARPLMEAMMRDSKFNVRIIVIPDYRWVGQDPLPDMRKCREELVRQYDEKYVLDILPDKNGKWPDALADFDIVSYPTAYELSDFHYNLRWSMGRKFLPIRVNYSLTTTLWGDVVFGLYTQACFWKVFLENRFVLQRHAECSQIRGMNGVLTGYTKMDPLASQHRVEKDRKTIIIAPHHSIVGGYNDMMALSNFFKYSEFFLQLPKRYPQIDFVFRPHPFLLKALKEVSVWGPENTDSYFKELLDNPNMKWSDEGDYFPLFAQSDGIIQDCGSFLIEYFYTGKPQCYMLKSKDDSAGKFLPYALQALDVCYQAYSENDIDHYLQDVILNGNDPLKDARESFAKEVTINYPHATEAALGIIKHELGMGV